MKKGKYLYKQFYKNISVDQMNGLQWFALEKQYGTSYGSIHGEYKIKKEIKLLDVGNGKVREMIETAIEPYDERILVYSDPDNQYSGSAGNKRYHELVRKYFGDLYDGTYIDSDHLLPSEKYSKDDLEGASEVVLWKNIADYLEETEGKKSKGGKTRKLTKKKC